MDWNIRRSQSYLFMRNCFACSWKWCRSSSLSNLYGIYRSLIQIANGADNRWIFIVLLLLLWLRCQLLYLTVLVFLTPQMFIIVLVTTNVNNLKLWSLYLKNDSICLLFGFLKHASSEVLVRDKVRKSLNICLVVAVTCNFTFDWDVKALYICL